MSITPLLNPEDLEVHKSLRSLEEAVASRPDGRFALALDYDAELRANCPGALADLPALARVGALSIHACGLEPKQLKMLLASKYFDQLTVLDLSNNFFHDTGAKALAGWEPLARVTHLALCALGLSSKGLATLAASPNVGALRYIDVSRSSIKGSSGIEALAEIAGSLEYWSLWGNDLGDSGVKAIAASALMRTSKTLNLGRVMMKKAGLAAVLNSPDLAQVETLDVSANYDLGDAGVGLIARAKHLGGIRSLDLVGTGMTDAAAVALAAAPVLAQLKVLRVGRSEALTSAGIQALQDSPHLSAEAKESLESED